VAGRAKVGRVVGKSGRHGCRSREGRTRTAKLLMVILALQDDHEHGEPGAGLDDGLGQVSGRSWRSSTAQPILHAQSWHVLKIAQVGG
jgi:hypothetical protein